MQINSTELAGLLAFVPAALGCCLAAARTSPRRQRKGWGLLAIIYALLTVEVLASTRHRIRGAVNDWLIADHIYPDRRPAQAAVILLLIVIGVIAARFVLRSVPTRRLRLATDATAANCTGGTSSPMPSTLPAATTMS